MLTVRFSTFRGPPVADPCLCIRKHYVLSLLISSAMKTRSSSTAPSDTDNNVYARSRGFRAEPLSARRDMNVVVAIFSIESSRRQQQSIYLLTYVYV